MRAAIFKGDKLAGLSPKEDDRLGQKCCPRSSRPNSSGNPAAYQQSVRNIVTSEAYGGIIDAGS